MGMSQYATFTTVRFDVRNNQDIVIGRYTEYSDAGNFLNDHLPDPSLGFSNSNDGSNILYTLTKFFTESPSGSVCGSIIVVLLKRYPNEGDYSQVVSLARQHHAVIHVISSVAPSGGKQPKLMYQVSSKTNGMCGFEYDGEFGTFITYLPVFETPFPIYATNAKVSGTGSIGLPTMTPPSNDDYFVMMTLQDYGPLDSFRELTLSWDNKNYSGAFDMTLDMALARDTNGTCVDIWNYLEPVQYDMTLAYQYSNTKTESIQIRVYSDSPLPYWLPYSD